MKYAWNLFLPLVLLTLLASCQQASESITCECPSALTAEAFGEKLTLKPIQCFKDKLSRIEVPGESYAYQEPAPEVYVIRAQAEDGRVLRIELQLSPYEGESYPHDGYSYAQAKFEGETHWWFYSSWLPSNPKTGQLKNVSFPGYTGWKEGMRSDYKLRINWDWQVRQKSPFETIP